MPVPIPNKITGTADAGGSSTSLIDADVDFTALNIQEGDTIVNTSDTPDSWASATYSVHRLAIAYTDNDDLVDIPILNGQTNASGELSDGYTFTSNLAIRVRIRSNQGDPKFIPFDTTGTITSDGYSLTAVLSEDSVAE